LLGFAGYVGGSHCRLDRSCSGKPLGRAVCLGVLILLPPLLLAQPLARKRLFCAALFSRLHVVAVLLDLFDDIFLLHFTLKTAQSIFQRLTFLNADFSHLDFTVLPMHVANIAANHSVLRGQPYKCLLALTSSGPVHRSQALFFPGDPPGEIGPLSPAMGHAGVAARMSGQGPAWIAGTGCGQRDSSCP
jgi:hypothetical protein